MGQANHRKDVSILKNQSGENNTDISMKMTSKLVLLEIDFICKIQMVLNQYDTLV